MSICPGPGWAHGSPPPNYRGSQSSTRKSLRRPEAPLFSVTCALRSPKCAAMSSMTAAFALPSTGGAFTRACQVPSASAVSSSTRAPGFTLTSSVRATPSARVHGHDESAAAAHLDLAGTRPVGRKHFAPESQRVGAVGDQHAGPAGAELIEIELHFSRFAVRVDARDPPFLAGAAREHRELPGKPVDEFHVVPARGDLAQELLHVLRCLGHAIRDLR